MRLRNEKICSFILEIKVFSTKKHEISRWKMRLWPKIEEKFETKNFRDQKFSRKNTTFGSFDQKFSRNKFSWPKIFVPKVSR